VFDIKVIDVPQAFVGLHGRAILLISRPALTALSASELQALAAHEVGHDFLWGEFEQAQERHDKEARRRLELQCDGIAALTLLALGQDPMRVAAAVSKIQRFNEQLGAVANARDYPSVRERRRFLADLLQGVR
jgi:predicted Zn-dependent protease